MSWTEDAAEVVVAAERDADESLRHLVDELSVAGNALEAARARAVQLLAARRTGTAWSEIVSNEEQPLIVEMLAQVQQDLGAAGARWRRDEANALHSEGMTMDRIAKLFGVTRQRVSTLLRDS